MAREYKDSGIEWIGQIPKEWKMTRGKFLFSVLNGYAFDSSLFTNDTNMMPLIRIRDINNSETEAYYMGDYSSDYIVQKGEVLVGMDGDFNVAKWKGSDALLNQRVCKLKDFSEIYISQYAYYILPMLLKTKNDVTYATTVKHLSSNDILNFDFIVPSITEQQKIADYLDKVCGEVDEMVALQETMIEELKAYKQSVITEAVTKGLNPNVPMRDSGIDWIGEIPEHWEVRRIKNIGHSQNGLTYSPADVVSEKEGTLVLRSSNIQGGKLTFDDNVYVSTLISPSLMVKKGDLIICSRNGSAALVGKCALVEDDNLKATYGAFMMRFQSAFNSRYIYYLLSSAISQYKQLFSTTTINQLTVGTFGGLRMPFTKSDTEQRAIASYLDTKCSEIDSLIALKQTKIEELKEYKKSVIYEYVTGKKEVM